MTAKLVLHTKQIKEDELIEIKIWQLPESKSRTHQVKFSIVYVKNGKRLIVMIMQRVKVITVMWGAKRKRIILLI